MGKYGQRGGLAGLMLSSSYLLFGAAEASGSLPFFFSILISLLGCSAVYLIRQLGQRKILVLFSLLGIAAAYFDFLDNPILTLAMPLVLLMLRDWHEGLSAKTAVRHAAIACGCWAISYGLFWASKRLLSSIVLGADVIADAASQASLRMSSGETASYPLKAIHANMQAAKFNVRIMQMLVGVNLVVTIYCIKHHNATVRRTLAFSAIIAAISVLPYFWYLILANHSVLHYWFTYRNQIGSLFSLACITWLLTENVLVTRKKR